MDIKSLMVGDWVQGNSCGQHCDRNNKTYYKIAVLDIGTHCWGYSVCGAIVELKYDDIFPIPLTAEILEKNLATEPQIAWCVGWNKKDDIHVEIKRDDLNAAFYGVIDFVHQLQHALRLCGIEKEIEL